MPRKNKEPNKILRKKVKDGRNCIKIYYDPDLDEHYQPHAVLNLRYLREEMSLPAIARR